MLHTDNQSSILNLMSETVRNKPEHRHVEFRDINLIPCLVTIDLPEKNLNVGHALFLHNGDGDQAILWHVFVQKEYRHKGFGTAMVDFAKEKWKEIATDFTTEAGGQFCKYNGFLTRNSDMLKLVWRR